MIKLFSQQLPVLASGSSKAGFPLAIFFARRDFYLLSKLNQFQLVAAESSRTKGKSSFAQKDSLVENRLKRYGVEDVGQLHEC